MDASLYLGSTGKHLEAEHVLKQCFIPGIKYNGWNAPQLRSPVKYGIKPFCGTRPSSFSRGGTYDTCYGYTYVNIAVFLFSEAHNHWRSSTPHTTRTHSE